MRRGPDAFEAGRELRIDPASLSYVSTTARQPTILEVQGIGPHWRASRPNEPKGIFQTPSNIESIIQVIDLNRLDAIINGWRSSKQSRIRVKFERPMFPKVSETINYRTLSRRRDDVFRERIVRSPKTWAWHTCVQYHALSPRSQFICSVEAGFFFGSTLLCTICSRAAMSHVDWRAPVATSVFKGVPSRIKAT